MKGKECDGTKRRGWRWWWRKTSWERTTRIRQERESIKVERNRATTADMKGQMSMSVCSQRAKVRKRVELSSRIYNKRYASQCNNICSILPSFFFFISRLCLALEFKLGKGRECNKVYEKWKKNWVNDRQWILFLLVLNEFPSTCLSTHSNQAAISFPFYFEYFFHFQ